MSLKELSAASGVSMAQLSQVERGLADPSLAALRKIAQVLDVPLFNLFEGVSRGASIHVQRADEHLRVRLPNASAEYARVSAGIGDLEVLKGELHAGASTSDTLHSHDAEECVVVISGTLVLEAAGQEVILAPGDSCHFRAQTPHRYSNRSDKVASFIIAVTPPSL